jgi:WD40 repeat protein
MDLDAALDVANDVDWQPGGNLIVSSGGDATIKLRNAQSGQCLKTLHNDISRSSGLYIIYLWHHEFSIH